MNLKRVRLSTPIKHKNNLYTKGYIEKETRDYVLLFIRGLNKACWIPKEFVKGY